MLLVLKYLLSFKAGFLEQRAKDSCLWPVSATYHLQHIAINMPLVPMVSHALKARLRYFITRAAMPSFPYFRLARVISLNSPAQASPYVSEVCDGSAPLL